jgi:hypothetical protein
MGIKLDAILEIDEGTTPKITATFTDESGEAIVDTAFNLVTIAVRDYHAGTVLRAATAVSVLGSAVSTWLTQTETAILDTVHTAEYRIITVVAQYSGDRWITDEVYIKINNLAGYSVP